MSRFDKEEQELLRSYEKGEWKSIRGRKALAKGYVEYARSTIRKDQRINIRISQKDLESLQARALEEGIPYQTLISSVLHKFVSGRLVQKY